MFNKFPFYRILVLFTLFSMSLTACNPAPALTLPESTLIPTLTPTLTPLPTATETNTPLLPQEVQEKFELAGIDLTDMQNAKYDKAGLHITLESGEVIVLTNTDLEKGIYLGQDNVLKYSDVFHDSGVYAYDLETGKWGEAAEIAAIALFNKYGVSPATYTLTKVDGVIVGTDKETGKEIFRNGRFETSYAAELAKKDCEPTNFEPDKWGFQTTGKNSPSGYLSKLADDYLVYVDYRIPDGTRLRDSLIDRVKQCWGLVGNNGALVYRDETGSVQVVSIIHLTDDEIDHFISHR